jgi:large subunit ribosomal protein L7/L12
LRDARVANEVQKTEYSFNNRKCAAGLLPATHRESSEREPSAMSDNAATLEFSDATKEMGDKIASLTLKDAKSLSDYLKHAYGIEPAAGGGVVMAAAAGGEGGAQVEEQTEFDVVMTGFGDKKLNVVKVVKNLTGATLMEAKKMVESAPVAVKEKLSKEEAEKVKAELEEAGASVELK